jgi:hypothetical protein
LEIRTISTIVKPYIVNKELNNFFPINLEEMVDTLASKDISKKMLTRQATHSLITNLPILLTQAPEVDSFY